MTERPANAFSENIINIFINLDSISVHKSLDNLESSSIIKHITSDNLFPNAALDILFKPNSFVPGLIPRP